jgi:thymidylate synthase
VKQLLILLPLCALPLGAHAEKGQSVMFGDPDPIYQEKTRDTANEEHSEHCKQLRRQMDELKGKPQRRHAVVERYKLECQPPAN